MTAASSNDGEFETSTTTCAPLSTSANPSPVRVFTPVLGAAATASCPSALSFVMSFDPISPVPPITTIFICLLLLFWRRNAIATVFVSTSQPKDSHRKHYSRKLSQRRERLTQVSYKIR